jgi:hypothetical protein
VDIPVVATRFAGSSLAKISHTTQFPVLTVVVLAEERCCTAVLYLLQLGILRLVLLRPKRRCRAEYSGVDLRSS